MNVVPVFKKGKKTDLGTVGLPVIPSAPSENTGKFILGVIENHLNNLINVHYVNEACLSINTQLLADL